MQASLFNEMVPDRAIMDLVRRKVSELARHDDPGRASWKSIKPVMAEAAASLRATAGQTNPPILLPDIAQLRRIHSTKYFNKSGSPHGVLVPTPEGFLVRLPNEQRETRNRTSMAHEIGHTFFYDLRRSPPTRLLARPRSGTSYKEEDLCKWFARELLMPQELVANHEEREPEKKLDSLIELANTFAVSPEVAAVRLLWDLEYLPFSVGLFGWVDSQSSANDGLRLQKYYGHSVKSLRKAESALLKSVDGELKNGPPFSGLRDIADQYSELATVEWKYTNTRSGQSVAVLLSFKRKGDTMMVEGRPGRS